MHMYMRKVIAGLRCCSRHVVGLLLQCLLLLQGWEPGGTWHLRKSSDWAGTSYNTRADMDMYMRKVIAGLRCCSRHVGGLLLQCLLLLQGWEPGGTWHLRKSSDWAGT